MYWYILALRNYFNFSGRSRRKEFWMFTLFNYLIMFLIVIMDNMLTERTPMEYPYESSPFSGFSVYIAVYALLMVIPTISLQIRRLHDTGRSGWNLFLSIIPLVGPIMLLVYFCTEGDEGNNEYGPDPKTIPISSDTGMIESE